MAAYPVCLYSVWDHSWAPKCKDPVTCLIAKHARPTRALNICPAALFTGVALWLVLGG